MSVARTTLTVLQIKQSNRQFKSAENGGRGREDQQGLTLIKDLQLSEALQLSFVSKKKIAEVLVAWLQLI
jgi:hypothetical protein